MKYFTKPPLGTPLNRSHPLNRGLIGWWLMQEGAGSRINDLSGNNNAGTLTNMTQTSTTGWQGGSTGRSLLFSLGTDYVNCGAFPASQNIPQITVSVMMKRTSTAQVLGVAQSLNSSNDIGLYIWSDGLIYFEIGNGANTYGSFANTSLEWQLITMVFDGTKSGTARLLGYVNGRAVSLTYTGTPPTTTSSGFGNFEMGRLGATEFEGFISDVRVYNRALSPNEVQQLYTDPFCMFEQRSLFRWFTAAAAGGGGSFFFTR